MVWLACPFPLLSRFAKRLCLTQSQRSERSFLVPFPRGSRSEERTGLTQSQQSQQGLLVPGTLPWIAATTWLPTDAPGISLPLHDHPRSACPSQTYVSVRF